MANSKPNGPTEWDEHHYQAALAHLETLQNQLDEVRLTIPHVMQSLIVPHPGPEQLFKAFKDSSRTSCVRITELRKTWMDQKTRAILARSKQSYENNKDLTDSRSLSAYGWTAQVRKPQVQEVQEPASETNSSSNGSKEDFLKSIEEFKSAHPTFEVESESDSQVVKIRIKPSSPPLDFVIWRRSDASDMAKLDVECIGDLKLCPAITRCLTSRPHPNDINSLLDMLPSFVNASSTKCTKCGKLLDRDALTPAARRLEQTNSDGKPQDRWIALHEACL